MAQRRGPAAIPADEWRNPRYLRFLREEGWCVVCRRRPPGGCDPCHGKPNGMGSKGPDGGSTGCIPMCREHHDEQGRLGWDAFERRHGIDRRQWAEFWWAQFQSRRAR